VGIIHVFTDSLDSVRVLFGCGDPDVPFPCKVRNRVASEKRRMAVALRKWISDSKIDNKSVEDMRFLCSCVNRAHGSLPEMDAQWVRAKISPFGHPTKLTRARNATHAMRATCRVLVRRAECGLFQPYCQGF
jgi:hypothetical protein